jgi:nitroimidazol reductase NimA-like FMN-containing flavoprotein (pyridoxamine 5'-phosphate oxidase superfamily)
VTTEGNGDVGSADEAADGSGGAPSARTRVRRLPERARYERAIVHAILDEGLVCHLGFVDGGSPVVIPTAYARVGDALYLHGAPANAALRSIGTGAPVCVTVTLIDGLVLARSAFHHSINYRSVVIFGNAVEVTDPGEKRRAVDAVVEHVVPGRGVDARGPSDAELRATRVVRLPIDEASAKVRTGGPVDDEDDMGLPIWAGHVPLGLHADPPVADDALDPAIPVPAYARPDAVLRRRRVASDPS